MTMKQQPYPNNGGWNQLWILYGLGTWFFISWSLFIRDIVTPDADASSTNTINKQPWLRQNSTHRTFPIDLQDPFSFVHISKNGGVSWIQEFKKLKFADGKKLPFYPIVDAGREHSLSYQDNLTRMEFYKSNSSKTESRPEQDMNIVRLATLRSPREHVWSQFRQCVFSGWGKRRMKHYKSFRPKGDLVDDFKKWLHLFVQHNHSNKSQTEMAIRELPPIKRADDIYRCYHPANFQSRFFAVDHEFPIQIVDDIVEPDRFHVVQAVRGLDWVGLLEFFHESKCLLYYRIQSAADQNSRSPNALKTIQTYLAETCHCRHDDAAVEHNRNSTNTTQLVVTDINYAHKHGHQGKEVSLANVSQSVLEIVDFLTQVDQYVYKNALVSFVKEVVWLERELGHRVMCPHVLKKRSAQLSSLGSFEVWFQKDECAPADCPAGNVAPVIARNLMELYKTTQQHTQEPQ